MVGFTSAVQMIFGLALTLATFVLVVVVAHFNSWDKFSLQIYSLGFRFDLGLGFRFRG